MAAYAALVSLMNTMEQIKIRPFLSTTIDMEGIENLGETVAFLLDFIESHTCGGVTKEVEDMESRIASAARKAEDAIESHVVYQYTKKKGGLLQKMMMHVRPKKLHLSSVICDLQKLMEDVGKVEKEGRFKDRTPIVDSSSRPVSAGKTSMVGFEDYLNQLMDRLTRQPSRQQIIPIIGMGGIGKTTLARNVFDNLLIQSHFDVCGWATISQNYSVREILLQLHSSKELIDLDEGQLGEKLHKYLFGRRYLIVLDDMWSIDVWEKINLFFPDNSNGSCIVVTSRLHEISLHFNSPCLAINFLNEDKSWNLFCQESFGEERCPVELEEVGKKICENCKGLPLCIVVIGGFLRESNKSLEYWEGVARDTYSILNSQGNNQCLNILSLSYNHLPAHLKPCFLHMCIFPEDKKINVSLLIQLWVAEGFLRPNESQTLEEIAHGYLKNLVGRNLILVNQWGSNGKMRECNMHDLIRELCLSIVENEKCLRITKIVDTPQFVNRNSKLRVLFKNHTVCPSLTCDSVFVSVVRDLICTGFLEDHFVCVNLRFLDHDPSDHSLIDLHFTFARIPKRIRLLWNLQTVRIQGFGLKIIAPSQLWKMIQLRHIKVDILSLPNPPRSYGTDLLLPNLQTLCMAINFRLSEEVCKRIPNVKKLGLEYRCQSHWWRSDASSSYYCPQNLGRFHKLESLKLEFDYEGNITWRPMMLNMTFPSSLKKLTLIGGWLYWKDMEMVGSLPNLEVLKLRRSAMIGSEWNTVEGQFQSLKFLEIDKILFRGQVTWNADDSHFPVLEKLVLKRLEQLEKIPSGIGDIDTLRTIRVRDCRNSLALSAVKILEEQEGLGNEDLEVEVVFGMFESDRRMENMFRETLEQAGGFTSQNLRIERSWF